MNREIVDALIVSLNDPDAGWKFTSFTATNDRIKCEIWLANGVDFVEVKFWGDRIATSYRGWDRQIKIGGDNMFGFLVPWRWRLDRAATARRTAALKQDAVTVPTIVAAIRSASGVTG